MSFDGPDRILPIFHHLMSFDGPKNLMSFDGPKSIFSPFKISCLLMDPTGTYVFKVFPYKTSCLLMDPLLDQNLMSFDGPKTSCLLMDPWWFSGSINRHEVFGSTGRHECTKNSCLLMDPDFQTSLGPSQDMTFWILYWVHQSIWGFFSCLQLWLNSKNELMVNGIIIPLAQPNLT